MEHESSFFITCSHAHVVLDCCGEGGTEPEYETLNLSVYFSPQRSCLKAAAICFRYRMSGHTL